MMNDDPEPKPAVKELSSLKKDHICKFYFKLTTYYSANDEH